MNFLSRIIISIALAFLPSHYCTARYKGQVNIYISQANFAAALHRSDASVGLFHIGYEKPLNNKFSIGLEYQSRLMHSLIFDGWNTEGNILVIENELSTPESNNKIFLRRKFNCVQWQVGFNHNIRRFNLGTKAFLNTFVSENDYIVSSSSPSSGFCCQFELASKQAFELGGGFLIETNYNLYKNHWLIGARCAQISNAKMPWYFNYGTYVAYKW